MTAHAPPAKSLQPSFAITIAPNGGRRTKADHPNIPLSAAEIGICAAKCAEAGAAAIHVHVRTSDGVHILSADLYRDAITAIRRASGDHLLIQITTEALGIYAPEAQMQVVRETRPEAVSLALRELLPGFASGERSEAKDRVRLRAFADFLTFIDKADILPQIILYHPQEAAALGNLIARGAVPWRSVPVLFVLGRYTENQTSHPSDLVPFLGENQPRFADWTVCAFGQCEAACVMGSVLMGGHVRVGFENNLFLPDGSRASGNEDLVRAVAEAARPLNYRLRNADDMRASWATMKRAT